MKKITYVLSVLPFFPMAVQAQNTVQRPNIIFLLADDYGAEDVKCYNPKTTFETPNIDRLAATGVQFGICYSTPLSGPSRALLMSGQYAQKTGHWCNSGVFNKDFDDFPYDLVNGETFYRSLHEAGYTTAVTGKWDGDKGITPKYFDEACIWPREVQFIPEGVDYKGKKKVDDPMWRPTARYWQPFIMKNGEFYETQKDDFGPDIFSDFVLDFVKRNKDGDKPYFVYYPMVLPHDEPVAENGKVATPDLKHLGKLTKASMVSMKNYVDYIVGKIVQGLKDMGEYENTIVIFSGDNGSCGKHGKSTTYEPGVWVPFIISCPALIEPRGYVHELVSHADVFPTLAELGGAKIPEILDGVSQVPVLLGKPGVRDHVYSFLGSERIIRTKEYLLEKNIYGFDGFFYYCGDAVYGSANETSKIDYINLNGTKELKHLSELNKLLRILDEKYPAPKGIPLNNKQYQVQRAYDHATGLY